VEVRVRNLALPSVLALIWLAALWFLGPDFRSFELIAAESEIVRSSQPDPREHPQTSDLHVQRPKGQAKSQVNQIRFNIANKNGISIFAPRMTQEAGLWVNSIPLGTRRDVSLPGLGLGPIFYRANVGSIFLGFSTNQFEFVADNGFGWQGVGPIWYADAANGAAFEATLTRHEKSLKAWHLWICLIGMLAAVLSGAFRRERWVSITAGAACLASVCQMFIAIPAPLYAFVVLVLSMICFALAHARRPIFASMVVCTIIGLALGAALYIASPPPALYLKFAWLSGMSIWPLAGVGLPFMAFLALRATAIEFVSARAKIAEQKTIIQSQGADLYAAIAANAVNQERQRFVRDMHDGIGGQLLSLLMQVRAGLVKQDDIETELQRGLHDLRLMTDSLDHVGDDLDLALTSFERRATQQLAAVKITLVWIKGENLNKLAWDSRKILNLYRILQEALTNCIRHAGATTISFQFGAAENGDGLLVEISDDGRGIDPNAPIGRGKESIAKRAAALGGVVTYSTGPSDTGTKIILRTHQ
jgi:signal transduction histidine kinase